MDLTRSLPRDIAEHRGSILSGKSRIRPTSTSLQRAELCRMHALLWRQMCRNAVPRQAGYQGCKASQAAPRASPKEVPGLVPCLSRQRRPLAEVGSSDRRREPEAPKLPGWTTVRIDRQLACTEPAGRPPERLRRDDIANSAPETTCRALPLRQQPGRGFPGQVARARKSLHVDR